MTSSSSRRSSTSSSDSHPISSSLYSLPAPRDSFVQLSSSSGSSRFRTSSVVSPGPASASSLSSASSVDSPGSPSSSSSSSGLSCPGCSRVLPNDKALIAHVNEHVVGAFVGVIPPDALLDRGYEACGQCHKFYRSGGGIASHKRACDRHLVSVADPVLREALVDIDEYLPDLLDAVSNVQKRNTHAECTLDVF